ncbi:hypothetical protein IW262DRAFT_1417112 [Armillaria fumosa]|nr:hypothetical protein IW262DRAFT_1417112 [Armillaria fumosa]
MRTGIRVIWPYNVYINFLVELLLHLLSSLHSPPGPSHSQSPLYRTDRPLDGSLFFSQSSFGSTNLRNLLPNFSGSVVVSSF